LQMHFQEILAPVSSIPVNGQYVQQLRLAELDSHSPQGAHHVYNTRDRNKYPNDELYRMFVRLSLTGSTDCSAHTDFEKDTLKTLWQLSESNTETEECFLRIPQTEYFYYDRVTGHTPGPDPLEEMPFVRCFFQRSPSPAFITVSTDLLSFSTNPSHATNSLPTRLQAVHSKPFPSIRLSTSTGFSHVLSV